MDSSHQKPFSPSCYVLLVSSGIPCWTPQYTGHHGSTASWFDFASLQVTLLLQALIASSANGNVNSIVIEPCEG